MVQWFFVEGGKNWKDVILIESFEKVAVFGSLNSRKILLRTSLLIPALNIFYCILRFLGSCYYPDDMCVFYDYFRFTYIITIFNV